MCGIFGCVTAIGNQPSLSDAQAQALRDLMIHRGPDDAGLWRSNNVLLTLRRLAVIDPTHAGHQPMVSSGTGSALVYNGELYNDAELRRELQSLGCTFKTRCDTETVLQALDFWGSEALGRLRGMYALAFYDHTQHTLLLARDALGVKPLYYTIANADTPHAELIFASEPAAILGHPLVTVEPDFAVVSAYLTTIRTTLGDRTLFKSVHTLQPGESIEVDLSGRELNLTHRYESIGQPVGVTKDQTRNVISESIRAHLRRDVPICCLLSGGLDSSIIAATVADIMPGELQTYCAGADDGEAGSDLKFSQLAASHIGSRHIRVPIDRELFASRMTEMITRQGVPLSTPNEVAINEVARKMRSSGRVVTLSGEGADELFAGYELPMQLAAQHVASGNDDPGIFQLLSNAWLAPELKPRVLQPIAWQAADEDALLFKVYREQFERVRSERGKSVV